MVVDITHTCRAGIVILVRLRRLHRHGRSLHLGDSLRRYLRHLRGLRILWGLLWGLGDLDAGLGVRVNIWVLGGDWKLVWSSCSSTWVAGFSAARAAQGVRLSSSAALRNALKIRFFMGWLPPLFAG